MGGKEHCAGNRNYGSSDIGCCFILGMFKQLVLYSYVLARTEWDKAVKQDLLSSPVDRFVMICVIYLSNVIIKKIIVAMITEVSLVRVIE